jgi:hypothetical protein
VEYREVPEEEPEATGPVLGHKDDVSPDASDIATTPDVHDHLDREGHSTSLEPPQEIRYRDDTVPVAWYRKLIERLALTIVMLAFFGFGVWEFRAGWRDDETRASMVGGFTLYGIMILWALFERIKRNWAENPRWSLRKKVE